MIINPGEVWFVNFPLEEDSATFLSRPVVVLDVDTLEVLSVKVTKTSRGIRGGIRGQVHRSSLNLL